jgi:hypothetical protein
MKEGEDKPNVKSIIPTEEVLKNKDPEIGEKKPPTLDQIKRMRKAEAMDFAEYKRRLRDSVELKKLQVEELELNVKYYHVRKEYDRVEKLVADEEAVKKAEAMRMREEIELKVKAEKPQTPKESLIIKP